MVCAGHQPAGAGTGIGRMGRLQRLARIGLLAASAWALGAPNARAEPAIVAEIASYQGADRAQRLVDGAKREKELTLYSSIPTDDIAVRSESTRLNSSHSQISYAVFCLK